MENNKCCYCKENVISSKEGFIGIISYHDKCFREKFRMADGRNIAEHITFYEG